MPHLELGYYKVSPDVPDPVFGTQDSACFDLHAYIPNGTVLKYHDNNNCEGETRPLSRPLIIAPGFRYLVPTGLFFHIPKGYSLRIHPRSGTAYKNGLIIANLEGIVDSDYPEETKLILMNISGGYSLIENGMRVCQAELVVKLNYAMVQYEQPPLPTTDRTGGFGHTGTGAIKR